MMTRTIMPRATFSFNLPDEQNEYQVMSQSQNMQRVLWDFSQQLRSWRKYHNDFKSGSDALEKITQEFYRIVNEYQVSIDL